MEKEGWSAYGKAQREYYLQYPRLLPKGITVVSAEAGGNINFQLYFTEPGNKTPMYMRGFETVQDAIKYKKEFFSLNVE